VGLKDLVSRLPSGVFHSAISRNGHPHNFSLETKFFDHSFRGLGDLIGTLLQLMVNNHRHWVITVARKLERRSPGKSQRIGPAADRDEESCAVWD
jgi:hypothetical protein